MTAVLHKNGSLPETSSVSHVEHTPIGEGVGMLSEIEFLGLTYAGDHDGAPASVVVKFPTSNEVNRGVAEQFKVYDREVGYFSDLDAQSLAAGPKVYLAEMETPTHFAIVLEDLSAYRTGDQVTGATLPEAEAAIDELAKMHASFWNKLEDGHAAWLPRAANSDNATNMAGGSAAGWDATVSTFGEHIPQHLRDAKDAYVAAIPRLQEHLDQAPRTLVHGDFRMDNLFFAEHPDHHPMTFVDWQGPMLGKGMFDVSYFLGQSTQVDVRRAHEQQLIERYVTGLSNAGVTDYDFATAWQDYRVGLLYIWVWATVIAGTLDAENERGNAWMVEMIKRNVAAIDDLDLLELL